MYRSTTRHSQSEGLAQLGTKERDSTNLSEEKRHRRLQKIRIVSEWALYGLGLKKSPPQLTTMSVLSNADTVIRKVNWIHCKVAKDLNVTSMRLENEMVEWIRNTYTHITLIRDDDVIEKACYIQNE